MVNPAQKINRALSALLVVAAMPVYASRPFTVDDSIGLTRTSEASAVYDDGQGADFPVSPDGKKFLVVTARGDVSTGLDRYELAMYDVDSTLQYVNRPEKSALPRGDVLVTFDTPGHSPGIGDVQWMADGKSILFVGRRTDSRVYRLDIADRKLEALTPESSDALTATLSPDGRTLIYTTSVDDYEAPEPTGYVLDAQKVAVQYGMSSQPSDFVKKVVYSVLDLRTGRIRELLTGRTWFPNPAWISPNSAHAVLAVSRERAPAHWWWRFEPLRKWQDRYGGVTPDFIKQYEEGNLAWGDTAAVFEFVLVDLATGRTTPIADAPISEPGIFISSRRVAWNSDSRQVVLSGTCVTLPSAQEENPGRCQRIVSFDLDSGALQDVGPHTTTVRGVKVALAGVELDAGVIRVLLRRIGASENIGRVLEPHRVDYTMPYRFANGAWRTGGLQVRKSTRRIALSIRQGLNEPWQIEAFDVRSGVRRAITDWNPQLRELQLGTLEVFEWRGLRGETVRAGLVKPPGFDTTRRYPLVIQTYGFADDEFLTDGAEGKRTMFSARALAARGMLVLQMPKTRFRGAVTFDRFIENREWLRTGVQALTDRGWVDATRVGLIGFSFTGQQTWDAVTYADLPLAAAILADTAPVAIDGFANNYGMNSPANIYWEKLIGGRFWGEEIDAWRMNSPMFNLDRIRTPLLMERYSYWPMTDWTCYTILKRERRPVEMIHRPAGRHAMGDVVTTRLSQQSAVDWFSFWLQDFEDSNPAKADQYVRWRKLRKERDALPPPPPKWTGELPSRASAPSAPR